MIVLAGGSGYLGGVIALYLSEKRRAQVINLSSRRNTNLADNVAQFEIDLTEYEDILESISTIESKIEVIINVAGRSKRRGREDKTLPDFNSIVTDSAHDLKILFNLARLMDEESNLFSESAKLIDIGSLWASRIPYSQMYLDLGNEPDLSVLLSKAGKRVLVKYLARELSKKGFTVNQLTPGWFPKPSNKPREDYVQGIIQRIPLGRIGTPSDLLPILEVLISRDSTYLNGQEIIVDGGFSIY